MQANEKERGKKYLFCRDGQILPERLFFSAANRFQQNKIAWAKYLFCDRVRTKGDKSKNPRTEARQPWAISNPFRVYRQT
jgi:hypothetical protein